MTSAQKRPPRRTSSRTASQTVDQKAQKAHIAARRSDDANAFIPDPEGGPAVIDDDLAQSLAEEFVENATTGQSIETEAADAAVSEEIGGPFVETTADQELAYDADASNPPETIPEPVPRAVAGIVAAPTVDEPSGGHDGDSQDDDGEGDEDRDATAAANDPDIRAKAPERERDLDALNTENRGRRSGGR